MAAGRWRLYFNLVSEISARLRTSVETKCKLYKYNSCWLLFFFFFYSTTNSRMPIHKRFWKIIIESRITTELRVLPNVTVTEGIRTHDIFFVKDFQNSHFPYAVECGNADVITICDDIIDYLDKCLSQKRQYTKKIIFRCFSTTTHVRPPFGAIFILPTRYPDKLLSMCIVINSLLTFDCAPETAVGFRSKSDKIDNEISESRCLPLFLPVTRKYRHKVMVSDGRWTKFRGNCIIAVYVYCIHHR